MRLGEDRSICELVPSRSAHLRLTLRPATRGVDARAGGDKAIEASAAAAVTTTTTTAAQRRAGASTMSYLHRPRSGPGPPSLVSYVGTLRPQPESAKRASRQALGPVAVDRAGPARSGADVHEPHQLHALVGDPRIAPGTVREHLVRTQGAVGQQGGLEGLALRAEGLVPRRPHEPYLVGGRAHGLELRSEGGRVPATRGSGVVDPVDA